MCLQWLIFLNTFKVILLGRKAIKNWSRLQAYMLRNETIIAGIIGSPTSI